MATLLQDTFDRAADTASLGTPAVGGPYTVVSGTWGINNSEAYLSAPAAGAQVTFPAAFNVDITYKNVLSVSTQVAAGAILRRIDASNFWYVSRGSANGTMALWRMVAGAGTAVTADAAVVAGDIIRAVAYGDQIALYVNGVIRGQVQDQWASAAPTDAGLRNYGTSTARWDDLTVVDRTSPIVPNWEGGAMEPVSLADPLAGTHLMTPSLYKGRDTALEDESEIP